MYSDVMESIIIMLNSVETLYASNFPLLVQQFENPKVPFNK